MLDEGVLNVSLLFQNRKGIDIDLGYDTMWHLIKEMLKDYDVTIEAKEIVGSYCPGSYDLSIRDRNSLVFHNVVFAEVSLSKSISALPEVALSVPHSFVISTTLAIQGEETRFTYPEIVPSTMASLSNYLVEHYSTRFNDASF